MSANNMYEEFSSCTIGKLKDYLSCRGISTNGNKQQLVSRCFVAWENDTQLKYTEKQLALKLQEEYKVRLSQAKLPSDPRSIEDSKWVADVKTWPKLDLGKIFSFILSKKEQEMEFIGQYKTKKAYSYFISGFVDTIYSTKVNDVTILKSKVTPSQSIRNEPHEIWMALTRENEILACWCSCIAGMAQTCNHAIAVGYKIEYATCMGYNDPSCTSLPCGWNSSTKKDILPSRISDMNFRQDKRNKVSGATVDEPQYNKQYWRKFDPRREDQRSSQNAEVEDLFNALYVTRPSAVLFTGFPKNKQNLNIQSNIILLAENFLEKQNSDSPQSLFMDYISDSMTPEQATFIENNTKGQSSNSLWLHQRKGRLTASIHHEISSKMDSIVKKRNVKITPLVSKILGQTSQNLSNIEAVKYGQYHESIARNLFSAVESKDHNGLKVSPCGLFVKPDRPYIAASPDGIVSCKCCPNATLEIKCPQLLKNEALETGWKKLDYLEFDEEQNNITLKTSHSHYTQVQSQMAVTGYKIAYFMVYSPKGSLHMKVHFNGSFWLAMQEKLSTFYRIYIVPYLLQEKTLYFCPKCEKVYCEVEEITNSADNSILCDCCDLWHHWKCVGVTFLDLQGLCSYCN